MSRLPLLVWLALLGSPLVLTGLGARAGAQPDTPGPLAAMRALVVTDPRLAGSLRLLFEGSGWSVVQ